jgi:hypothetical protein
MGILASARNRRPGPPGRWIMVPRSEAAAPARRRSRVIRRRRQTFERLLAAAAVTFLLGFVPGLRWMWLVHLGVDGILGLYISRLLKWKRDEQERARIVRRLAEPAPPTAPEARAEGRSG